ncbi:MAG: MtnX-like HAD-IB family phosphatase [Candidatus Saccharibacteria bacterium]
MRRCFFIDFDGTITLKDTCYNMVASYCRPGWKELNEQWERREMGTTECARRTLALMDVEYNELQRFLSTIPIDPLFKDFIALAAEHDDRLYILSDGYDVNIKTILGLNGLDHLPYYSNNLLCDNNQYDIESPNYNEECGLCGTCKTSLVRRLTPPGYLTVYIGDGYSDRCAVHETDIVFAKKSLLKYCRKNGVPTHEFQGFQDIIAWMKTS